MTFGSHGLGVGRPCILQVLIDQDMQTYSVRKVKEAAIREGIKVASTCINKTICVAQE